MHFTSEHIRFLDNNPVARKLLYRSACVDWVRADETFRFLREAYMRHFPVTLSVEVGGISCSMEVSFDEGGPGFELYNYLGPWVASMALKDNAIAQQMADIWPDLPGWYMEEVEKRRPQIDREDP